jgi:hypothetical protein
MTPSTEKKTGKEVAMTTLFLIASSVLSAPRHRRSERGDVPGWVLITVMSAGLVAALWAVAGPQLSGMLREALGSDRG